MGSPPQGLREEGTGRISRRDGPTNETPRSRPLPPRNIYWSDGAGGLSPSAKDKPIFPWSVKGQSSRKFVSSSTTRPGPGPKVRSTDHQSVGNTPSLHPVSRSNRSENNTRNVQTTQDHTHFLFFSYCGTIWYYSQSLLPRRDSVSSNGPRLHEHTDRTPSKHIQ